jgi:hypothetical protein
MSFNMALMGIPLINGYDFTAYMKCYFITVPVLHSIRIKSTKVAVIRWRNNLRMVSLIARVSHLREALFAFNYMNCREISK